MRGSTRVQQHDRLMWAWRYCERPLFVLLAIFVDLAEDRLQQWVCLNAVFAFLGLLGKIRLGGVFHTMGNGEPLAFGKIGGFKGHDGWWRLALPPIIVQLCQPSNGESNPIHMIIWTISNCNRPHVVHLKNTYDFALTPRLWGEAKHSFKSLKSAQLLIKLTKISFYWSFGTAILFCKMTYLFRITLLILLIIGLVNILHG